MADAMKRATIKFPRNGLNIKPLTYVLGVIDTTHFYMIDWYNKEPPTDEQIQKGCVYHVSQLKDLSDPRVYEEVWDWLRGLSELNSKTFKW